MADTLKKNEEISKVYIGAMTTDTNGILHFDGYYDASKYTLISARCLAALNYYFSGVMNARDTQYGESVVAYSYTGTKLTSKNIPDVEIILFRYA